MNIMDIVPYYKNSLVNISIVLYSMTYVVMKICRILKMKVENKIIELLYIRLLMYVMFCFLLLTKINFAITHNL